MDFLTRIFHPPPERNVAYIIGASVITTVAVLKVSQLAFQGKQEKIIRSPRETLLPRLSGKEIKALAYPPDILPGGRDVESPYGTIRVYEWGPEDGRKVLFVHGITTPCIALGSVAHGLVEKGCRVMLLDLWGRGYSDSPADLEHDERLYATQLLIAVTSSPLFWTGTSTGGGFSLIGYSLGGGIAASFASYFPAMVNSLVLLAPAGLIRPQHMSSRSRFLYSMGIVPEAVLKWGVERRLKAGPMYRDENKAAGVRDAVSAEVEGSEATSTSATFPAPLSQSRPNITVDHAVAWQLGAHKGFVHSFMSSVRFAPITGQENCWRKLGKREDRILIFAGETDPIIIPSELREDVENLVGEGKVEFRLLEGAAHDFPVTNSREVVEGVWDFWKS